MRAVAIALLFFVTGIAKAQMVADSAMAAYRQILAAKPQDTAALGGIADIYFSQKSYDSALVYLKCFPISDSSNLTLTLKKAFANYKLQRYAEAETLLRQRLDSPSIGNSGRLLLAVLFQQRKYNECMAVSERILEFHQDHIPALMYQGILWRNAGNLEGARLNFEKCLQLEPGYLPARELHAEALLHDKKYEQALQEYEAVGMANIRDAASFNNIGICYYELHDFKNAIHYFELALDSNWQMSEGYFNRGMAYYSNQSYDSASVNWLAASALWDSCSSDTCRYFYKDALYCLGHCYKKLGEPEKALRYFEWLQGHHYERDLQPEIRKLRWSIFIATRWYYVVAAFILLLSALLLALRYFRRTR
ncbi:MAG: tetratricopeptide repeat protein [Chitinophagales bacterium]